MNTDIKRLLPLVLASGLLLAFFRLQVGGLFLTQANLIDLAEQVVVNGLLALGITFTILIGGIDLSVGSVVALSGTVTVYLLNELGGAQGSIPRLCLAAGAGLAIAAGVGLLNGACASLTRMPPFIITLATMQIARGAALRFNDAKPISVPDSEKLFQAIGNHRLWGGEGGGGVPVPVVILLAAFVVTYVLLHRTRFGQHLFAIGGNREAARYAGISLARHETCVYVLCASLAGVAGIIQASRHYSAVPSSGEGFELSAIAAAVVGGASFKGGVATISGTLLGAAIIGILDKGLNQAGVHFSLKYIVKGLVILSAVYLDVRRSRS